MITSEEEAFDSRRLFNLPEKKKGGRPPPTEHPTAESLN